MGAQWPGAELHRINKGLGWKSPQLCVWEIMSVPPPPSEDSEPVNTEQDQVNTSSCRLGMGEGHHERYTTQACSSPDRGEGPEAEGGVGRKGCISS